MEEALWKPERDDWGQASETAWVGRDGGNALRVYRLGSSWVWRVSTPEGFTMSGVFAHSLGEALQQAEQASWKLSVLEDT